MSDIYFRLHHLLRRLLQRNRFVRQAAHTSLSLTETYVLLELDAAPDHTITALGRLLGVDQGYVSRTVQGLVKHGLLTLESSEQDRRQKVIGITKAGKRMLRRIDRIAGFLFDKYLAVLSAGEVQRLTRYFRQLADGFHEEVGTPRPGEHPFRVEQRRLTRCLGVLKKKVFGSSLSVSQWLSLAEICARKQALTPKELSRLLTIAPNSLTSLLDGFENAGYVKRSASQHDSRSVLVNSTAAANKLMRDLESKAVAELQRALQGLPFGELEDFITLLDKFVGTWAHPTQALPGDYEVRRIRDEDELRKARAFAVRETVRCQNEGHLTGRLLAESSAVYGLHHLIDNNDQLSAVAEVWRENTQQILGFVAWSRGVSRTTLQSFLVRVQDEACKGRAPKVLRDKFPPLKRHGIVLDG